MRRAAMGAAALVVIFAAGAAVARVTASDGTPCQQLPPDVSAASPPPGFDPRTATAQELAKYGFPAHLSNPVDMHDRTALDRAQTFRCPAITPSTHEHAR
jgi:hypothetical protein